MLPRPPKLKAPKPDEGAPAAAPKPPNKPPLAGWVDGIAPNAPVDGAPKVVKAPKALVPVEPPRLPNAPPPKAPAVRGDWLAVELPKELPNAPNDVCCAPVPVGAPNPPNAPVDGAPNAPVVVEVPGIEKADAPVAGAPKALMVCCGCPREPNAPVEGAPKELVIEPNEFVAGCEVFALPKPPNPPVVVDPKAPVEPGIEKPDEPATGAAPKALVCCCCCC